MKLENVTVPLGSAIPDCGIRNPSGFTLQYNEFIVYDVSKIRFKYLVKVKLVYRPVAKRWPCAGVVQGGSPRMERSVHVHTRKVNHMYHGL